MKHSLERHLQAHAFLPKKGAKFLFPSDLRLGVALEIVFLFPTFVRGSSSPTQKTSFQRASVSVFLDDRNSFGFGFPPFSGTPGSRCSRSPKTHPLKAVRVIPTRPGPKRLSARRQTPLLTYGGCFSMALKYLLPLFPSLIR